MQDTLNELMRLKARYFRFVDTKAWADFGDLFTEDAIMIAPSMDARVEGRAAIVEAVSTFLKDVISVHHGRMPEIDIQDDSHATAIWAMEDHLWSTDPTATQACVHGYGHYHEQYIAAGGRWRIRETRITRLYVEVVRRYQELHPNPAGTSAAIIGDWHS
jgi:hypothetical protein